MTAYAAFRNPTEYSFKCWRKKWIEKIEKKNEKKVKSRDNKKKATRWIKSYFIALIKINIDIIN